MRLHTSFVLAALGAALIAFAAVAAAVETQSGQRVVVTGAYDQLLFVSGEEIVLGLEATDDVAAAGGEISVLGSTLAHAFLAGGDISFADTVAHDLFAAAGEIELLSGQVLDDLVAAGARITLRPSARVGGDAVLAGGRLRIEAPIEGELRAAGRDILLDSAVTGDVYIEGRSIVLGPNARIGGALTHRGHSVQIASETEVAGEVTALLPRPGPDLRPLAGFAVWAGAALLFGLFLMAIVVAAAFPRLMNDTAGALRTQPLTMLGLGAVLAILTPFVVLILIVTLLGLPLAFVLATAFALLWPLALVGAVYAVAMLARTRLRRDAAAPTAGARALWAGVAMIAFILVGLIPVIGFVVWLIAYLFGLGAVSLQAARAWAKPAAAAV